MKKSLIILLGAALAFVSCAKVSPSVPGDGTPELPITFQAANYASSTKAGGQSAFPTDKSFKVQAYYTGSATWESVNSMDPTDFTLEDAVAYMEHAEVKYDSSTGKWAPTGQTYYWPKTGYLSFIGWANVPDESSIEFHTDYSQVSFSDIDPVDGDFMLTDVAADKTAGNSSNGVPMTFHHMLAKVNFKAMAKNVDDGITHHVVLNSIKINDIGTIGNYKLDFTDPDKPEWNGWDPPSPSSFSDYNVYTNTSPASAEKGDTIDGTLAGELGTSASDPLLQDGQLVIPQELETTSVVELNYVIYFCNSAGKVLDKYTGSQEKYPINTFSRNGTPITTWEKNTIYTYTIVIDPNSDQKITFIPEITDWSTADAMTLSNDSATEFTGAGTDEIKFN